MRFHGQFVLFFSVNVKVQLNETYVLMFILYDEKKNPRFLFSDILISIYVLGAV